MELAAKVLHKRGDLVGAAFGGALPLVDVHKPELLRGLWVSREHVTVKVRRVVAKDGRVDPLGSGQISQRGGQGRGRSSDLGSLAGGEVCPGIGMTTGHNQKVADQRLGLKERWDVEGKHELAIPEQAAR